MPDYRRAFRPGGTFFFAVVTEDRAPILCAPAARRILHAAIAECRASHPFDLTAIVLLPDHLHAIWTLPQDDTDFSSRWAAIKARLTHNWLRSGHRERPRSRSRFKHRNRGVWQRRFWEHAIRDESDFEKHLHYVHYNPIKHALARCAHAWPHSTFQKWVKADVYVASWQCGCNGTVLKAPDFHSLDELQME